MESDIIDFNVKIDTLLKIVNSNKRVFERDISNDELARKLFLTDEDGDYVCQEQYKDEMELPLCFVNITRMGDFPFRIRKYDKIRFVDWYGGIALADIRTVKIYRFDRYWRISYKIDNVVKVK